jgi:serine/threonine protein kinase
MSGRPPGLPPIRTTSANPLDDDGEPLFKGDLGPRETLQPIRYTNANSSAHQSFVYFIMKDNTVTGIRKIVVDTPKTDGAFEGAKNEVVIYMELKQKQKWKDYVLPFRGFQKGAKTIVIDFDYVPGEDLLEFIRKEEPSKKELAAILKDAKAALAFCHAANVFHGDIKPDNFYVERGTNRAYIFDFGEGYMEEDIDPSLLVEEDATMQKMVDSLMTYGKGGQRRTRRARIRLSKRSRRARKTRRA